MGGATVASAIKIPIITSQIQQKDQRVEQLSENDELSQIRGFRSLNPKEQGRREWHTSSTAY
ncbi:MAG: hypothetical protein ACUVWK_05775 [Nitrososphaerales archaeon]